MKLMPFAQLVLTPHLDIMIDESTQFHSCDSLNNNDSSPITPFSLSHANVKLLRISLFVHSSRASQRPLYDSAYSPEIAKRLSSPSHSM